MERQEVLGKISVPLEEIGAALSGSAHSVWDGWEITYEGELRVAVKEYDCALLRIAYPKP